MVRAHTRKKPRWFVLASYPAERSPDDERLEKLVGRMSDGSGMGFGRRDIDWSWRTGPPAKRAAKKLAKLRGVHVELERFADEDDIEPIESYVVK